MLQRVPFEIVSFLDEAVFKSLIPQDLLQYFGWSKREYENELLFRIDKEWITIHRASCLSN